MEVAPLDVQITPDSLIVQLPRTVRREEVELGFRVSVADNPYFFVAAVGRTQQTGLWQEAVADGRFASTVFLPEVPSSSRLIDNLSIRPAVLTPNGDGIGDLLDIRFSVPKLDKAAMVRIYALNGSLIRECEAQRSADGSWGCAWSGRDARGILVAPGTYLVRVGLDSETREERLTRSVAVAY